MRTNKAATNKIELERRGPICTVGKRAANQVRLDCHVTMTPDEQAERARLLDVVGPVIDLTETSVVSDEQTQLT